MLEFILIKALTWLGTIFIVSFIGYCLYALWENTIGGLYLFNIIENILRVLVTVIITLFCLAGFIWLIASGNLATLLF